MAEHLRKTGAKRSNLMVGAVVGWLRMKAQGIVFVTAEGGDRRAALAVGPEVWTVAEAWLQHDIDQRTTAVVADAVGVTAADVENALAYWADYQQEIDGLISGTMPARTKRWPPGRAYIWAMPSNALTAPDGQFAASAVEALVPPPYRQDAELLITALQRAAQQQQIEARQTILAGVAVGGVLALAFGRAGK